MGGGVCSLLRAKAFTWIPPVRQILALVPRFDREFFMTFAATRRVRGKIGARFEFNFVFNGVLCLIS